MACANCGTLNPSGAKFCAECGQALALSCPSCETGNPPAAKFCTECATPLGQVHEAAPSAPRAIDARVAERRLVSVLFADLVGFTPFAEERDAEEVRETLTRYFEVARETVERYGGTVEKFIGDAVMAVWGTPIAREDDAERAVRAALELTDAVRSLGDAIQARAGVLTGEAAVTLGATGQGMVAGDIVNTAARIQSVAEPGAVLVGEATKHAASAAIAFEEIGEASLKGKRAPVPTFRALRVVAERGGRNRAGGLEPPFVGRDEEMRQLKEQYHAASREGRPRLVSVMGPAGIGKSRLAWELLKYIDGLLEPVWWHSGRSPSYGEGITFWALGEMIRTRAGLAETDDESTTRQRIAEMLAEHVPDEAERRWIEPAMLTLLGIGDQQGGSEQHFAAWRTFFERMAATGPVALVFEDLHWADTGLLDFIDHLLEWTRDRPIYIVTLARPELLEKRPTWGAGKRQFTSLFLEPLGETAMQALLGGLVPGLPAEAMRAIVERADGVPLYAVETVRMLAAEGRLEEHDGAYAVVGELTTLAIPDTLTALIASRLDALDPDDRDLLQDASVLGQSFTLEGLAAVAKAPAGELEPRLRALARRELLVLRADPRAPDRGQYAFVQALIREVAYNTLARADRKARHLAAARHFESLPTDELAGALAGHYLSAQRNSTPGPEADALAGQARIALKAAAERATRLGAHDQAARFLVQALDVTADADEQADLLERAGNAAAATGSHDEAIGHLERARSVHESRGDRRGMARVTAMLGRTLLDVYYTDQAVALLEAARTEFGDLVGDASLALLESQLARGYFFAEQHARAVETAERVVTEAERHNLIEVLTDALVTKGTALGLVGRTREGLMLVIGAGALAERAGYTHVALRAAVNRSFAESLVNVRDGFASAQAGLALARRLGLKSIAVILAGNAAEYAMRLGEWDFVDRELPALEDDAVDPTHRVLALATRAVLAAARGEKVDGLLADLHAIGRRHNDPSTQGQIITAAAQVAFSEGRLVEAREQLTEAARISALAAADVLALAGRAALWNRDAAGLAETLEQLEAVGAFGDAIEASTGVLQAGLAGLRGRHSDALTAFRHALRTWREQDSPLEEAMTAIDMASALPVTLPEVSTALEAARAYLVQLGARPLVARIDALLESAKSEDATPARRDTSSPAPEPAGRS